MLKYILKRISLLILTMVIIITVVFFLLRLMPGYPSKVASNIAEAKTPEERAAIIAAYNTYSNAFVAFWHYISGIFHGEFGTYYQHPSQSIPSVFLKPLKYTMMVTGPAFLIGTVFGIIFGFISGYKRGKWPDIVVNIVATFFVSVPSFVLAMFLLIFGNKIGLPISYADAQLSGETILALVLPIAIISITSFSTLTYYIRNEVVEVLTSDYISIARAKGLSESKIFFKHVIRNVSLPFITIVFPSFLSIIFGSMIVEMFFQVPGSSHVFAMSVTNKERDVIMFSTIFFTAFGLIVQLIVDMLYIVFDPRITMAKSSGFSLKRRIHAYKVRKSEKDIEKVGNNE